MEINGSDYRYDRPSTKLAEHTAPPRMDLERSSSFARSFFQSAGQDVGDLEEDEDVGRGTGRGSVGRDNTVMDDVVGRSRSSSASSLSHVDTSVDRSSFSHSPRQYSQGDAPVERSPGGRRRSRRRLSRGSRSGSMSHDLMAIAAAAAAASDLYDENEPIHNLPHQGGTGSDDDTSLVALPRPGPADRQTSWYTDALLQGGGSEDLSAFLGQMFPQDRGVQQDGNFGDGTSGTKSGSPGGNVAEDDEVLEQYRIMAHVEASIRVKDNTGFDLAEYEKRRKIQPEPVKGEYFAGSKKPKPTLPEPKRLDAMGGGALIAFLTPQEPSLPPRTNIRFSDESRIPRAPDLYPGIVIRNTNQAGHIPDGEHAVRCLGCQSKMRVNLYAALVQCPECRTVSPASTARG